MKFPRVFCKVTFLTFLLSWNLTGWVFASAETAYKKEGDAFLRAGKTSLAIEAYQKSLKLNPDSTATYFNLAVAYYAERHLDDAARTLEKLIEKDPHDTEARYNLGCLCLYKGELEKAHVHFKCAFKCCGRDSKFAPLIHRGLELIDALKKTDQSTQDLLHLLTQYGLPPVSV